MLVSTKGRYALRVMIELALSDPAEYIKLSTIAERQEISEKYLESIIVILSKAGLVDAVRGKGGGYRLKRRPDEYSVYEILKLTENSLAPVACLDCEVNTCERAMSCRTLPMWEGLNNLIKDYLMKYTLDKLIEKEIAEDFQI
ncbi:MAG: Rrf2 family transcriptional regulator [Oscillospiraceae bacterium]|nr:Rrf2 family transcriptional regulator [Oscillospiraceae bacterium]